MKKFIVMLLACVLLCWFAPAAWAAGQIPDFSDIADQSQAARNAIMKLAVLGVLEGDKGEFRPNDTLTRAEFAKIVCYLTDNVKMAESMTNVGSRFSDVNVGQWYNGYVNAAAASGYFIGDPSGIFRPSAAISMNEVVTVALLCIGYHDNLGSSRGNTSWPGKYIIKAHELGLLDNVNFEGSAYATRTQAAIICEAALDKNMVMFINPDLAFSFAIWAGPIDIDGFVEYYYRYNNTGYETAVGVNESILHRAYQCYSTELSFIISEGSNNKITSGDFIDAKEDELLVKFDLACVVRDDKTHTNILAVITMETIMKMAEKYYITNGLTPADLPGLEAAIIYNEDDEIVFVDVLGGK